MALKGKTSGGTRYIHLYIYIYINTTIMYSTFYKSNGLKS